MYSFLKRAAERTGFTRDVFLEKNVPTISSNIVVFPFFGDIRSTFILSAFLLKRYKEVSKKYLILASWPGFSGLFPYVDEYWGIKDTSLAFSANNFYNSSSIFTTQKRNLIEHFENIIDDIKTYYDNGFTTELLKNLFRFLPGIPASKQNFSKGKVVIYPVQHLRSWQRGVVEYLPISKEFWERLVERLLTEGFLPVIYQNFFTYDLSPIFANRCLYITFKDITLVLAAMREIGCVLDIHSGVSRLALAARCPFIAVDERIRFDGQKEYEIDDLFAVPRQYIFHFSTMLMSGTPGDWDNSIINNIIVKLRKGLDKSSLSTAEVYESVSYELVRKRKARKLGVHFIGRRDGSII